MEECTEDSQEAFGTILEHVEALRRVLIHCFLIILGAFLLIFPFSVQILTILTKPMQANSSLSSFTSRQEKIQNSGNAPLEWILPANLDRVVSTSSGIVPLSATLFQIPPQEFLIYEKWIPKHQLQILNPIEGFLVTFKISVWMALFLSSPFWIARLLRFLIPALTRREKKLIFPLLVSSYLAILLGLLATFYGTLPAANAYFFAFNEPLGENFWSLSYYVQFSLWLFCANIVSCECAAIGFLLVQARWISYQQLQGKRRFVILGAFIIGALLTPPDILTQFLVAIPLILFYEFILVYAKWLEKITVQTNAEF